MNTETKELQLVTCEQAKRMEAVGFNLKTYNWYDDNILKDDESSICFGRMIYAPTVALALKWFRDVKSINSHMIMCVGNKWAGMYYDENDCPGIIDEYNTFDTYEAAESELLDELLTILEQKK